jgi:hypothetical protein
MRIKLRLNPEECESKLLLRSMNEMEDLFKDLKAQQSDPAASIAKIFSIIDALERDAPILLKKEWERVKKGEPIYRKAKWAAAFILVLSAVASMYFFHRLLQ